MGSTPGIITAGRICYKLKENNPIRHENQQLIEERGSPESQASILL